MAKEIRTIDEVVRAECLAAAELTGWNMSQSAKLLGIDRRTLHRNLDKWGYTATKRARLREVSRG